MPQEATAEVAPVAISPGARTTGFDHSATIVFRVFEKEVVIVAIHYRGRNVHARL